MANDPDILIGPDSTAFRLELTPAQLKVTHSALRAMLQDFGHDELEVIAVVRQVLDKLPQDSSIRAIDLGAELRRGRGA